MAYARREVSFTDLASLLQADDPQKDRAGAQLIPTEMSWEHTAHRDSSAQCPSNQDTACPRKEATGPTYRAQAHSGGVMHFKRCREEHKWEAMDSLCLAHHAADMAVHILTPAAMKGWMFSPPTPWSSHEASIWHKPISKQLQKWGGNWGHTQAHTWVW